MSDDKKIFYGIVLEENLTYLPEKLIIVDKTHDLLDKLNKPQYFSNTLTLDVSKYNIKFVGETTAINLTSNQQHNASIFELTFDEEGGGDYSGPRFK